jgi:hypothetical protein
VAYTPQGKNKSPAPSADARQKKSPASVGGVEIICFFFKVCKGGAKLLRFFFCQVVFCAELVSVCASPPSIIQGGGTARNVF